jgi:hypothetical protein
MYTRRHAILFSRSRPEALGSGTGCRVHAAMWGVSHPAGSFAIRMKPGFGFPPGVSRIVLRDRRHRLPNVVYQPKNLVVIAKRINIAGISGDLNNGPWHAISLGPEVHNPLSV